MPLSTTRLMTKTKTKKTKTKKTKKTKARKTKARRKTSNWMKRAGMYLKVRSHLISHQAQAQERNALIGLFSGSGQSPKDFHADALRHVQRYRQVRPRRVVEDESADVDSLGSTLQLPTDCDAGLWRVHVKVSTLRARFIPLTFAHVVHAGRSGTSHCPGLFGG
jgi:hypothetical protein